MAGGTSGKGDSLTLKSLGSVIAANSCSTAADISATVLAGKFEILGGKTIARDLVKSEKEKVSIPEQLGPNLANDHQPGGQNEHHHEI
jgi:hypothetical protein